MEHETLKKENKFKPVVLNISVVNLPVKGFKDLNCLNNQKKFNLVVSGVNYGDPLIS